MLDNLSTLPSRAIRRVKYEITGRRPPDLLHQAVNFDLECIFIAIPKTGTTTVRGQISPVGRYLIWPPHLSAMQIKKTLYTYLLMRNLSQNTEFPTQGVPTDKELEAQAAEMFEKFFKFSAVRNPWARTVSLYFRNEGLQNRDEMTFEKFCETITAASDTCRQPTYHRDQASWLEDEDGNLCMDFIYKVEEAGDAFDTIRERTNGRIALENVRYNENSVSKSKTYREMYNDHTRDVIGKLFERDVDLFKYTF